MFLKDNRMFLIPAEVYIPNIVLQSLYDSFTKPKTFEDQAEKELNTEQYRERLTPQLSSQKYIDNLSQVIDEIYRIAPKVYIIYTVYRAKAEEKRKATTTIKNTASLS